MCVVASAWSGRQWVIPLVRVAVFVAQPRNDFFPDIDMAQPFTKSAAARDLTLMHVANMSEDECHQYFCKVRWRSIEQQVCPSCGSINRHYYRKARRQWRCKDCDAYFSVTSGTPLHGHKMTYKKMLLGLMQYVQAANGIATDRLSHEMDVQVKTAHVFGGKIREALMTAQDLTPLSGLVQIDGAHFGGMPRFGRRRRKSDRLVEIAGRVKEKFEKKKGNAKDTPPRSRTNRTNWERCRKNRRIVIVLRQVSLNRGEGGKRTITAICKSENMIDVTALANRYIAPGSHIMTDENPAYTKLDDQVDLVAMRKKWRHDTVNHSIEFSSPEGVNDNQCESYFSRMRRWVKGVSHRSTPKYMADRATEFAWREDNRRVAFGQKLELLLTVIFNQGPSVWWRGYWQGHHREDEILFKG